MKQFQRPIISQEQPPTLPGSVCRSHLAEFALVSGGLHYHSSFFQLMSTQPTHILEDRVWEHKEFLCGPKHILCFGSHLFIFDFLAMYKKRSLNRKIPQLRL